MTVVPRLTMTGVRKRFGGTLALRGVDLHVAPGEVHALVGENGAGKSTLMKVLSGAVRPNAGTMTLDGIAYAPSGPTDARRRGVALEAIAAVVLGGASLNGGQGTVTGTLMGVLILKVLENGVDHLAVAVEVKYILIGVVIIANTTLSRWQRRDRLA